VSFWRDLSPGVGMIFRIAVFSRARRIVLATSTGIHWSSIPPLGGNYSWQSASWPNLDPIFQTGSYSGLAAGPSDSVAAAAFGTDSNFSGIFFGTWIRSSRGFKLVMKRATITGARPSDLFRTSLASGASNRAIMYAVAARGPGDSWMFGVLKSTDGGRNWSRLSTRATSQSEPFPPGTALESGPPPAPDVAGGQGNYNNCIAVSPVNPEVVAIGWRNGPWVSTDGGSNWVMKHSADDNRHLHPDLHAVYFDPNDPLGEKLFVGSDGGVVVSPDRGETFDSSLNQRLLNLQFQSQPPRRFYGRFTASSATLGLIGGGLQDNGNVYCLDPAPWRQLDEGDGQLMMFFPMPFSIGNLLRYSNDGVGVKSAIFSGGEFDQLGVVPVTAGKAGVQYPNGLQGERLIVESVREPQFRQAPLDLMFAVAGLNQDVYGLFANSIGADMHWEFLGTVPIDAGDAILAVGSGDGKTVFAGSDEGRLFAMNPRDGSSVEQRVPQPIPTGSFFRIVVGTFNSYAILNTRLGGLILRANGNNWEAVSGGLPEEKFFSLEVPFGGTVFVATDRQVYVSANSGNNWFPASVGLPVRPHCSDLRYVQQKDGQTFLYLSTFGRSAWRIRM